MIIIENVDFVHHTPMMILPMGALCEVNCEEATFSILESGVAEICDLGIFREYHRSGSGHRLEE